MFKKFNNIWNILRSTLWFMPALFCFFAVLCIMAVYVLERYYLADDVEFPALVYSGPIEDAQRLIETLLSSMITMTTLAISITMVVLSLASSQLGPRLIKSFMGDRVTQIYIGLFFGSIVSCFMALLLLYDGYEVGEEPPQLLISFLSLYVFVNLFVLLFFVHHVAQSCIADSVIDRVARELMAAIERLPSREEENQPPRLALPADFEEKMMKIPIGKGGYVQTINYDKLVKVAARCNLILKLDFKSGGYLVAGQNGVYAYPAERVTDRVKHEMLGCFVFGSQRTSTQDLEYAMRHLVEIALRALSPGINDPFTAATVIDHLSMALGMFFNKEKHLNVFYDKQNSLRVSGVPITDENLIEMAYGQIRRAGRQRTDISMHLLQSITNIAPLTTSQAQRNALKAHVRIIIAQVKESNVTRHDYNRVKSSYQDAAQALTRYGT